jgi:hypothetical protein
MRVRAAAVAFRFKPRAYVYASRRCGTEERGEYIENKAGGWIAPTASLFNYVSITSDQNLYSHCIMIVS